jgi:hypothetical protein
MGRPTVLTPEIQEKICTAIEAGNYMDIAAVYAGVPRPTFMDWLKWGARYNQAIEKGDGKENPDHAIYGNFSYAVDQAMARSEIRDVVQIDKHAKKSWQAAAWKLERRFQTRWGRKEQVDMNHSGGMGVEVSAKDALVNKLGKLIESAASEAQSAASDEPEANNEGTGGTEE